MYRTIVTAGMLAASLGFAGGAGAQVCELPGTVGTGGPVRVQPTAGGPFRPGGRDLGGLGGRDLIRPGGRDFGRPIGRPGRGEFEIQRQVIIPAEYRIVERRVWVEPVYEYITREVWVPQPRPGKQLHIDIGKLTIGVNLGKHRGADRGYYHTVTEKVLIQPGYYRTVSERILVRPERVEIVSGPRPVWGGFGEELGVRR